MKQADINFDRPQTPRRHYFTLEQANRALVLVRRIVRDVVEEYRKLLDLQETIEAAQSIQAWQLSRSAQQRLVATAERLQDFVAELDDIGVELRDWAQGVVDFPAVVDGREVCLCWQLDEPAVEFWHSEQETLCDKQPIQTLYLPDVAPARR